MSLRVQILASGSTGNATLISAGKTHILVDCGLAARPLRRLLLSEGVAPSALAGVFLSHEHTDHVKGLRLFMRDLPVPLFAAPECLEKCGISDAEVDRVVPLEGGRPVTLGRLSVTPFLVPHDSAGCFGFSVEASGVRAVMATDLGEPTALVRERLRGSHCQLVEFNHDLGKLMHGSYPTNLKMRVKGRLGHLSNDQAARLVSQTVNGETCALFLMHLSKENNLPELALLAAREALGGRPVRVDVARPHEPTATWEG